MKKIHPDWEQYEDSVFKLFQSIGNSCERNIKYIGARGKHQIDTLVRLRPPMNNHFWLVECKLRTRPVGKNELQSFKTVIDDCGADHGYLISESGFQSGTILMSKSLNITLSSIENLEKSFRTEQLKFEHQQSTDFFTRTYVEDDDGNENSSSEIHLISRTDKLPAYELFELHIIQNQINPIYTDRQKMHQIFTIEECKKFQTESNDIKLEIPCQLKREKFGKYPYHFSGTYILIFRTYTGPVYTVTHVPSFK